MSILASDKKAETNVIGVIVGILVMIIISILVFYNIAANIDYDDINQDIAENVYGYGRDSSDETGVNEAWEQYNNTTPASNGSDNTLEQAAIVFQIFPIIVIVIIAAVIIGYVSRI